LICCGREIPFHQIKVVQIAGKIKFFCRGILFLIDGENNNASLPFLIKGKREALSRGAVE
jgi:hypothetical protein